MNIVSFDIEITKKASELNEPVIELIGSRFRGNSTTPLTYSEKVLEKWNGIKYKDLIGQYDSQQIITSSTIRGIDYFLILPDTQNLHNQNDITLQVLLISRSNNVSITLNHVIVNIKKILFGLKVVPIIDNPVTLFPFDKEQNDIYDYIRINAEFKHITISQGEKITYLSFLIAAIFFTIMHIVYAHQLSEVNAAILIGIYCAGYIFVISEVIFKYIIPISFHKHRYLIEISDLANPIEKKYPVPFGDDNDINQLQTPQTNG